MTGPRSHAAFDLIGRAGSGDLELFQNIGKNSTELHRFSLVTKNLIQNLIFSLFNGEAKCVLTLTSVKY